MRGNVGMIHRRLDHGVNPELSDASHDATPAGWAEHFRQPEAKELLHTRESIRQEVVETELRYGTGDPVHVNVVYRAHHH